jgi:hypothetical protein
MTNKTNALINECIAECKEIRAKYPNVQLVEFYLYDIPKEDLPRPTSHAFNQWMDLIGNDDCNVWLHTGKKPLTD